MKKRQMRYASLVTVVALGSLTLACGLGGGAPPAGAPLPEPTMAVMPSPAPSSQPEPPPAAQLAILEARRLTLEFPPRIRAGDADVIRLTLEVDDLGGITPTAEIAGHATTGETLYIPNLYGTHNVIAEARLDLAGLQVTPEDAVSEPLRAGQSVTFYWSIHAVQAGLYRGTIWLHLLFTPLEGGEESRVAVSAQVVEIEAVTLLGLHAEPARLLGGIGTVLSSLLGLPFLEEILKFIWARARRGRPPSSP